MWSGPGQAPIAIAFGPRLPFQLRVPTGTKKIPLLVQLVSAAAVLKGFIPLHASAFCWKDRGVLVAGWSKGGKTETLLAFLERGASYVGDEWLFMSPTEPEVSGIPEPMRIWDWHLDDLPRLRRRLDRSAKLRLAALKTASRPARALAQRSDLVRRAADVLDRQRYVQVDPAAAFGPDRCLPRSVIDVVLLTLSTDRPGVRVRPSDGADTAARISASTTHEHLRLLETELKRQFAFPGSGTPLWEALEPSGDTLTKLLADLPAFEVTHPYPVATASLFEAIAPVIEGAR